MMSPRVGITIILIAVAVILAAFPDSGRYSLHGKPAFLLNDVMGTNNSLTPDQLARSLVTDDSTIQLIDLRLPADFNSSSLPGAINIPYENLLSSDLENVLEKGKKLVFYGKDDFSPNYALVLAKGLGFSNSFILNGGLNAWEKDIMQSSFSGGKLTARENALYETRFKARKMFNDLNNLPDSLKAKYKALKEIERKKLDGGCE